VPDAGGIAGSLDALQLWVVRHWRIWVVVAHSMATMLATICTVSGALLGAFIAAFFTSRNGSKDREHRDQMARLEDWRRQRDLATQLVRSPDPGEWKQGLAQLKALWDDPVAPQRDRDFIWQIAELAEEAIHGRVRVDVGTRGLEALENCGPLILGPGPTHPALVALAETLNQRRMEFRTGFEQMRLDGIRMYGGLPPDQRTT